MTAVNVPVRQRFHDAGKVGCIPPKPGEVIHHQDLLRLQMV
jgi:hypothetical protein